DFTARRVTCEGEPSRDDERDDFSCWEVTGPDGKVYGHPGIVFVGSAAELRDYGADGSRAPIISVLGRHFPNARRSPAAYWPWASVWRKVAVWAVVGAVL